jgi:proteic killer suppression protein
VIRSFKHKGLRRFAETGDASKLSVQRADRITRMLTRLEVASSPLDMNVPGWRFHELAGDRKGDFSVTVSGNWRLTFRWSGADAVDVDLEDYH